MSGEAEQHAKLQTPGVYPFPGDEWWDDEEWLQQVCSVIENAQAEGVADCYGGVLAPVIAERVERSASRAHDCLYRLALNGHLKRYKRDNPETDRVCYAYAIPDGDEVFTERDADPDPPWHYFKYSREEWGDAHGVIPELLPFSYRNYDRLEHLAKIREFLSGRPQWCERVGRSVIKKRLGATGSNVNEHIELACLQLGWWHPDAEGSDTKRYFYNPEYVHPHREQNLITDTAERRRVLETALGLGMGASELGRAFGVNPATVRGDYAPALIGDDWHDVKAGGRRRLEQTIRTIRHWGHTGDDVAAAFGYSREGIANIVSRVKDCGYTPPEDPTYDAPCNDHPGEVVR